MAGFYRLTAEGARLNVRVTPNAGADRIEGIETRADGEVVLRIRVAAVPDKGKANAAVVAVLARALGVPKTAVAVAAGDTARLKTIAVTADPSSLAPRLDALAGPSS